MNAARDGAAYTGKNIYVVGGADGAVKEALYLASFAKQLTIIHFEDQLGCIAEFRQKVAAAGNIKLRLASRLHAVYGQDQVERLEIASEHDGHIETVKGPGCGIFVYAGVVPNTELFTELTLENGYIPTNEKMETAIPGVYAAGDIQVDVLVSKLKSRFNVETELKTPRVPYREKIRKTVSKQGRHKKQTGGSGQFGDVWIRFEPNFDQEEMVFAEEVFGGSVPKNFFPAVEKGLREACVHGPLAGYPVVNLKAVLYDGSYHPVDSSEIAFKTAAQLAYKAAMPEANPVLLEPVGELKVTVPDSYMGDVIGDLNKRRGRVMGMTPTDNGEQVIEAEVPMAEMTSYAIDLRAMTQSRGSFTFHFVRYEDCPPMAQAKAIEAAKAMAEE